VGSDPKKFTFRPFDKKAALTRAAFSVYLAFDGMMKRQDTKIRRINKSIRGAFA
jgi:hypothetical protein